MTDARAWLEDYNSYSSGDDTVPGAALHVATAALLAVLDLHKPETEYFDPQYDEFLTQCDGCYEDWPCDTVRAIDKALRFYRNPFDIGDRQCDECGRIGHAHGWIDTLEGGHSVCPGDGANALETS